ncbi:MAG TPA: adenylate/guanylate cyclase domain-containing protein [Steroidobacteraceae bacterium]
MQQFSLPEEMISALQDGAPEVLFVDADCPRFAAAKACRLLKEHSLARRWPLFVVSCSARACGEALAAGADDFLTPQIPLKVLLNRLQGLARLSLARRDATMTVLEADGAPHEKVQRMVRRCLLPQSADWTFGKGEVRAGPEICAHAVILFADLRGYRRISQRLRPQDLVPLLNEYYSLLTQIADQHGGTIFQIAGQSLLVGFGVAQQQSDGPERAIHAGQEMLSRFGELSQVWGKRSRLSAGIGVGLHEGIVAAATVGSPLFMSYSLVGDAVNIASRLCQRARAGEMVFAGTLKRILDATSGLRLHAVQLPPITLRNQGELMDMFCVPLKNRLDLWDEAASPVDQRLLRDRGDLERLAFDVA